MFHGAYNGTYRLFRSRNHSKPYHYPSSTYSSSVDAIPNTKPDQVIERLSDATIVISNKSLTHCRYFISVTKAKFIAIGATGTNNVDIDYCHQHHLPVANIRGYATRSVPEHVIAMIFGSKRCLTLLVISKISSAGRVARKQQQFCFSLL